MRKVINRILAGTLSAAMIIGTAPMAVFAEELLTDAGLSDELTAEPLYDVIDADGASELYLPEDGEEAVNDYYETGDDEDIELLNLPGSGSGTETDPWLIDLNTPYDAAVKDGFFSFNIEESGYIEPDAAVVNSRSTKNNISIYSGNVSDTSIIYKSQGKTDSTFSNPERIGVAPGRYILKFHMGAADGYSVKVDFTPTDRYEEELDSMERPKHIKADGKTYYGATTPKDEVDIYDYYCFTLDKKSKVTFKGKSEPNYYLAMEIFSDPGYSSKVAGMSYEKERTIKKDLAAGTYYIKLSNGLSAVRDEKYEFSISAGSSSSIPKETGSASINGEKVSSLQEAFANIKEEKEYFVELDTDMIGEKNLTIPKKATKVTIAGNGHRIEITGTKFTSNANLVLNDVEIKTVNKSGKAAKLTLAAKKDLTVEDGVFFDTAGTTVNVTANLILDGAVSASTLTTGNLVFNNTGILRLGQNNKVTVKKDIDAANGGTIELGEGFNKPVTVKGTAAGSLAFSGKLVPDGTQILAANRSKLSAETLSSVFDVSGITANTGESHLYYSSKGKACLFGANILYNEKEYGLWKDVVDQMNIDSKNGTREFTVTLTGDVNTSGAFSMPKKGYDHITIDGQGHTITFTGDIKLTGNTTITDLTLNKVNKKGQKVPGKIIKGKFEYSGPEAITL